MNQAQSRIENKSSQGTPNLRIGINCVSTAKEEALLITTASSWFMRDEFWVWVPFEFWEQGCVCVVKMKTFLYHC